MNTFTPEFLPPKREPLLNVPFGVTVLLAVLALIHAVRVYVLSDAQDIEMLLRFAFIPARYDGSALSAGILPGGFPAQIWSFVSYAFLHADVMHLGFNGVWLLAFGSAVARRFRTLRFFAFMAVCAAGGALLHLVTHAGELFPMVGASAAISGAMAAAMRFAFQRGGPLGLWRRDEEYAYRVPAIPLSGVLRDPRVLAFLAVWFGVNLLFGIGSIPLTGNESPVAWQAHIGGFAAGLFLFGVFDPVARPVSA